ncbi:mediator of RNA polymerase II transcription subunit 6 [Quercus suber]|uniref:mediator of RNA polymerase II transcription subunit 6 n=1 Tax=Quercus suber TaxID=58331 RepID=UPI0032DF9AD1
MRSIHPLDLSHLSKMTGTEYMLYEVMEPHLFVIRKQKRDSPEKVTPMLTYYILDGSIYQAPQLCNVFAARISRSLYHISKAFTIAASKLEKIGYGNCLLHTLLLFIMLLASKMDISLFFPKLLSIIKGLSYCKS